MPPPPLRFLRLLRRSFSPSISTIRSYSSTSVWSFGDNSSGALGLNSPLLDAYEPTRVSFLPSSIASVAAGHYHSLAVTADGQLWSWGRNDEGQLGRGANAPRATWIKPERVAGLDHLSVRAAFASGVISAVIGDDGSLWVWGRSKRGQLGLGKGVIEAIQPTKIEALSGHEIIKVSFGWGHALAQTKEGKLFRWGYSKDGRIGHMGQALSTPTLDIPLNRLENGARENSTSFLDIAEKLIAQKIEAEKNMPILWEPYAIEGLKVSDIACGLDHSLILLCDGTLLSCGENTYGQLGRKTEGSEMLPINMDFRPLSLSAGLGHSLALCQIPPNDLGEESVGVFSWGWNSSSQLGRQGQEEVPAIVDGLKGENPVTISAGRAHSITLTSKGEVWAWGSGRSGRLGLGSSADEVEPVLVDTLDGLEVLQAVAGFDHSLLLVAE